jgi:hypothetical protein
MRGTGKTWLLLSALAALAGLSIAARPDDLCLVDEGVTHQTRIARDGKPRGKGKRTKDWQF